MLDKFSPDTIEAIRNSLRVFLELPLGAQLQSGLCLYLESHTWLSSNGRNRVYVWCQERSKQWNVDHGNIGSYVSRWKEVNEVRRAFASSLLKEVEEFIESQQTEEAINDCNHQEN